MIQPTPVRRLAVVAAVLVVALVAAVAVREVVAEDADPIVIVHWSNSHLLRDGLLPEMADDFNADDHETASGQPIEVLVLACDSAVQAADLTSRIQGSGEAETGCRDGDRPAPDPTIVTPQSGDWLVGVNHQAAQQVVDVAASPHIAETWLGIVTYREMAECLASRGEDLGYADILELRADPEGWAALPCSRTEWGRVPLLAFTNPSTSTAGRNVLVSLYAMAAGEPLTDLTVADVRRPEVIDFVEGFQSLVDHYMPGTIPLNTKIVQGPRFGHFFLMPEDNLVSLYEGNERAIAPDGTEQPVAPVRDLVMIYPEEGSVLNDHPAGVVAAPWVTSSHREAAQEWIDHLAADEQQERFMRAGFRPPAGSSVAVDERQFETWGLDAEPPAVTIEPSELDPAVLEEIVGSWGAVKNPAVVTFVVDVSGSMEGEPLEQVQEGLTRLIDAFGDAGNANPDNQLGLVTFASTVLEEISPAPYDEIRFGLTDSIAAMEATGGTALYDAIRRAVYLTESTVADDPRTTRSVVVLSDGAATEGGCLDDLVTMRAPDEALIATFCGLEGDDAIDEEGRAIALEDISGGDLLVGSDDTDVQIFFLGFGAAEVHVGRILAEATGAEYQGSTDGDLAGVIEELSGYF